MGENPHEHLGIIAPVEKTPAKTKELAIKNANLSNKRPWRGLHICFWRYAGWLAAPVHQMKIPVLNFILLPQFP
jgi:hypothetical protein